MTEPFLRMRLIVGVKQAIFSVRLKDMYSIYIFSDISTLISIFSPRPIGARAKNPIHSSVAASSLGRKPRRGEVKNGENPYLAELTPVKLIGYQEHA